MIFICLQIELNKIFLIISLFDKKVENKSSEKVEGEKREDAFNFARDDVPAVVAFLVVDARKFGIRIIDFEIIAKRFPSFFDVENQKFLF